ncbi:hypothetical protein Gotri_009469 [Gossypium trilobum]|uniref:Uncharacterized protein n=1 Tax=Gossypium trilobum TaxID=34281 RepID=A0A7J9EN19_9ROSI|nr:hypothetical protein [Gossypium trilobum]
MEIADFPSHFLKEIRST